MTPNHANVVRVAIIVDNPFRDLPGVVLLARELAAAGLTCLLVPINLEWREIGALAPDAVVLTNIRAPRQEFAAHLVNAGIKVAVLENEGGVMPNFDTYRRMTAPDAALFRRLSCFCTWGPKVAGLARDEAWYRPEQVVVTGAPRFDFYAPQWRAAALEASAELEAYREPLILINGSFPRSNPRFATPEQEVANWQRLGFDREHIVRFRDIEHRAMLGMAEVANHLARQFPSVRVVYRPHPFERTETYEPLLEKRDNLELLKVGTVEGWILRSTVIVHRNSTTAIEAAMCGKPALLPTWLPTAETLDACDAVSVKCDTWESLDARIAEALAGTWTPDADLRADIDRTIGDWFCAIDGRSHVRVAQALTRHCTPGASVDVDACRRMHYGWRESQLTPRSRVGIAIRMALGIPVTFSFVEAANRDPGERWAQSEKFFDAARVQSLLVAIEGGASSLTARQAENHRDYRVSYSRGRSVIVEPLEPVS